MSVPNASSGNEKITLPPNVAKIVSGLQSLGYTPLSAIADVIDNSIDAQASHINVDIVLDVQSQVQVRISDSGTGMSKSGLENAMTYGAPTPKPPQSLGRFGLGLKTASTSMSDVLTVVSSEDGSDVNFATWDMDVVKASNDWVLTRGEAKGRSFDAYFEGMDSLVAIGAAPTNVGTVVIWEKTFGILKSRNRRGPVNPKKSLETVIRNLRAHLAITYQRFLDLSDDRARNVVIAINGDPVMAWDPFCTQWVTPEDRDGAKYFKFELEDRKHMIICRNFILPLNNEVEDPAYGSTNRVGLESQGIYLYRNNRLIEGPSWFGMGKKETHINRLRVELSFGGELDDLFALDVTKSDAMLDIDPSLQELLTNYLLPMKREADNRQRSATAKAAAGRKNISSKRPSELTIARTLKGLDVATQRIETDGSITLEGNSGDTPIVDETGKSTGQIMVLDEDADSHTFVDRRETLEHGSLWEAAWAKNIGISVMLNTGHDWFRKAYLPNATNEPLVQAIDYLFFALAQAEYNNTNPDERESFEQFRIDVSRNLKKLVKELPEPPEEATD
jgi:hypothetical protein